MTPLSPAERAEVDALIKSEWPKLERFFRSKVPPSDIHDLAQNTLLGFVKRPDTPLENQRAYLWTIARRQVIDFYRRGRGDATAFDSSVHSVMHAGPTLSSVINRKNQILKGLQSLPVDHQTAIELKYGEGLTDPEGAVVLDVSMATYKRYVSAGLETLRRLSGVVSEEQVGNAYRGG
ncbi:MAG: RNA polymerase sigma factor [Myxococcales bacterium]|nr:RNA polymerase sigma factor [Myxococcales bacterium]